jgi:asparagine synthase (glutamine-hydrolysing)
MCGIAGIFENRRGHAASAAAVHQMCNTLVHRGPDDEGIYTRGPVALGMRRLSIIDLESGHQPIHNEDSTVWVVFNGEIYNFQELRKELETAGHRFYTHTDTEVIVHLYEDLGRECVTKLRGMFAIAVYDEQQHRLLLARDRLGIKPLHYSLSNDRLLFGSEIKALLAVAPDLAEVSPDNLVHYFHYGYIPEPFTAFRLIHKLPPGHILEFDGNEATVSQYWELPRFTTYDSTSEEECLEELEAKVTEAVRIRLIADVPLGAMLSGGVDSSTVVALMARAGSGAVKTFSIGFSKRDFNEAHYARKVAERFGTEHHELLFEPDFIDTLDKLTHHMEEPFADSSMLPTYYVSRLARQHVTVALSGDGGDELFGGYDRYMVELGRNQYNAVPAWLGSAYRHLIFPILPSGTPGRRFVFNVTLPPVERYLDSISFLPTTARERSLFSPEFLEVAGRASNPIDLFRKYLDEAPVADPLSRLQYLDVKTYLPGDILTKVDRMSMANSLEARVPLLDHPLVEWASRLSAKWKVRNGQRKYILLKLAERLGVPRDVLYRPKRGFALPLVHWMREGLKSPLLSILLEPRTSQRGYFDQRNVGRLIDEHRKGRRDRSAELWLLLVFELWHRNFLEAASESREVAAGLV